jgi:hypothetical protein
VADCEPQLLTGDLSEDDLATGGRLSAALTELLPDMVRHYASRLEEPARRSERRGNATGSSVGRRVAVVLGRL